MQVLGGESESLEDSAWTWELGYKNVEVEIGCRSLKVRN